MDEGFLHSYIIFFENKNVYYGTAGFLLSLATFPCAAFARRCGPGPLVARRVD
jgi:hypothetical protein